MSQIQISVLQKINQALAKTKALELELEKLENNLKQQAENYKIEEDNTKLVLSQKRRQDLMLAVQAENLTKQRKIELETKIKIGQIVDTSISDYLTEKNINDLISKIVEANSNKKYTIEADPEMAQKLGILDYQKSDSGNLRINFEFTSYILDPENLYNALRPRLLTKILN